MFRDARVAVAAAGILVACCISAKSNMLAASAQSQSVKAGAELFGKSGCTFCHGPAGMGTERAPSLRDVAKRLNDEQIRHQVHDGGKMMPPFGDALTEEEIGNLSEFLRAKDAWELVPAPAAK